MRPLKFTVEIDGENVHVVEEEYVITVDFVAKRYNETAKACFHGANKNNIPSKKEIAYICDQMVYWLAENHPGLMSKGHPKYGNFITPRTFVANCPAKWSEDYAIRHYIHMIVTCLCIELSGRNARGVYESYCGPTTDGWWMEVLSSASVFWEDYQEWAKTDPKWQGWVNAHYLIIAGANPNDVLKGFGTPYDGE